jgi:pimeloyl-ACP methyl ester carboxylesterase
MSLPEWIHRSLRMPYLLKTHRRGRGRPIVFLHGIASFKEIWEPIIDEISDQYNCIAIDLLGHGKSPKPTHIVYDPNTHLRSIRWTLFWKGVWRRPIVVGHSMGALLATYWASTHPREVRRLVLVAMPIYQKRDARNKSKRLEGLVDAGYLLFYRALRSAPQKWAVKSAQTLVRHTPSLVGQAMLNEATWYPVASSLSNTIEQQDTLTQINNLDDELAVTVLYGTRDHLVISQNLKSAFLGRAHTRIMRAPVPHEITPRHQKAIIRAINSNEDPWYVTQTVRLPK